MRMMDTVKTMLATSQREYHPSEMDLQDMGLARSDFDALSQAPKGARARMVFIAERFGVSKARLNAEHWRAVDMARTCAGCGLTQSCERLRLGQSTEFTSERCPNAAQFSEMTV